MKGSFFLGLDLAGAVHRPTGWAVLDENLRICSEPGEIFRDEEIMEKVEIFRPRWIGIDAPLSFPDKGDKMREGDRQLRRFGVSTLSPYFIASLTRRGIKLQERLQKRGFNCIEVFPRATQEILRIRTEEKKPHKNWRICLQKALRSRIINLTYPGERVYSSHILDALLCAYTAWCREKGVYQEVGDEEGKIVVPLP